MWWTGGGAAVSDCDVYDNSAAGVRIDPVLTSHVDPDESSGLIENSRIHDNLIGVLITCATTAPMDMYRDVTVSSCNITRNLKNGIMTDESSPYYLAEISLRVINTTVDSNGEFGISLNTTYLGEITYFPIFEITNCVITNHTVGAVGRFGNIKGSTIANNSQIGLDVFDIDEGINQNNIYGNGIYNVASHVPFASDVNATQNWWGTTNKTLIEASIYDYYEDYNLSRVLFEPYLTSPIPEFPSILVLLLFVIATFFIIIVCKRHHVLQKTQVEGGFRYGLAYLL